MINRDDLEMVRKALPGRIHQGIPDDVTVRLQMDAGGVLHSTTVGEIRAALSRLEAQPEPPREFRVIWWEMIAGEMMPFSGRVYTDGARADQEAELKCRLYNYHGVLVESRPKSEEAWPHPLDSVNPVRPSGTADDQIPAAAATCADVRTVFGPRGCACIKDLPGEGYTCSAHERLFRYAMEAEA